MSGLDTPAVPSHGKGMLCPVCKVDLLLSERQGIEIDYCPQCRGVWLDRGELDKIIERSEGPGSGGPAAVPSGYRPQDPPSHWDHDPYRETGGHGRHHGGGHHGGGHHGGGGHGGHRRGGFLGRLFD